MLEPKQLCRWTVLYLLRVTGLRTKRLNNKQYQISTCGNHTRKTVRLTIFLNFKLRIKISFNLKNCIYINIYAH